MTFPSTTLGQADVRISTTSAAAAPAGLQLSRLPPEMLQQIGAHLDWESLRNLRATSWQFQRVIGDELLDKRMERETAAAVPMLDSLHTLEGALDENTDTPRINTNSEDLLEVAASLQQNMVPAIERACAFVGGIGRWRSPARKELLVAIFAAVEAMRRSPVKDWENLRRVVIALANMNGAISFGLRSPVKAGEPVANVRTAARICYQQLVQDYVQELLRQSRAMRGRQIAWKHLLEVVTGHLPWQPPHRDADFNLMYIAGLGGCLPIEDVEPACNWLLQAAKGISHATAASMLRKLHLMHGPHVRSMEQALSLIEAGE